MFLDWLVDTLEAQAIDALIIAGDVFDSANPPAAAERLWFEFLAHAHTRMPQLTVVVIAGNHDSAARLSAASPLLRGLGVHVVGTVPLGGDVASLLVPIRDRDRDRRIIGHVAAVPYLRPSDLFTSLLDGSAIVEGARDVYARVGAIAQTLAGAELPLVVTGHCHLVDGIVSELSERRLFGGNEHALPLGVFPEGASYVALGHLHRAQQIKHEHVRYSGSPIALSMPEGAYDHEVVVASFDGPRLRDVTALPTPRLVELLRVPERGPAPLADVLGSLGRLELRGDLEPSRWPLVEVRVKLPGPDPELRSTIERALDGKPLRLARISAEAFPGERPEDERVPALGLDELSEEHVFCMLHRRELGDAEPDPELLAAFRALVAEAQQGAP